MQRLLERLSQFFGSSLGGKQDVGTQCPRGVRAVFDAAGFAEWYPPVILGPSTLGTFASKPESLREALRIVKQLSEDDYVRYMSAYYAAGLDRFGDHWRYADIVTVLLATARFTKPRDYLEIGVRRGRSMAMVASSSPDCRIVGFDMWVDDYAGMPNPGPELVRSEMTRVGYKGQLEFITGNSHKTVPQYLETHPDAYFDIITVDGDHTEEGATIDLQTVIPRLKIGGVLVFDDIVHPEHLYLKAVWDRVVTCDRRFATWEFTELGYGVALAVRRNQ